MRLLSTVVSVVKDVMAPNRETWVLPSKSNVSIASRPRRNGSVGMGEERRNGEAFSRGWVVGWEVRCWWRALTVVGGVAEGG